MDPVPKITSIKSLKVIWARVTFVILVRGAFKVQVENLFAFKHSIIFEWILHIRNFNRIMLLVDLKI